MSPYHIEYKNEIDQNYIIRKNLEKENEITLITHFNLCPYPGSKNYRMVGNIYLVQPRLYSKTNP